MRAINPVMAAQAAMTGLLLPSRKSRDIALKPKTRTIGRMQNKLALLIASVVILSPVLCRSQPALPPKAQFTVSRLTPDDTARISKILAPMTLQLMPADEAAKYPGGYWDNDWKKQSFHIVSGQKGLEDVYFVPIEGDIGAKTPPGDDWQNKASLLIINRGDSTIHVLPEHPVTVESTVYGVASVAFRDVRGDGSRAIIVDMQGMTGIGPSGADPFDDFAVYLPLPDGGWTLDPALQDRIAECGSLNDTLDVTKIYFTKKPVPKSDRC